MNSGYRWHMNTARSEELSLCTESHYWMRIKCIILTVVLLTTGILLFFPHVASSASPSDIIKMSEVTLGDIMTIPVQYHLAVGLYDAALQISPNDPAILQKKGDALSRSGDTLGASEIFKQILEVDPNNTAALIKEGDLLAQQGDLIGALANYEMVHSLDPDDTEVLVREGDVHLAFALQEQQKLRDMAHNLSQPPGSSDYQVDQANMSISTEHFQDAIQCYEKAIRINPMLSVEISARVLAMAKEQLNTYDEVMKEIRGSS